MFTITVATQGSSGQSLNPRGLCFSAFMVDESDPVAVAMYQRALSLLRTASTVHSTERFDASKKGVADLILTSSPKTGTRQSDSVVGIPMARKVSILLSVLRTYESYLP